MSKKIIALIAVLVLMLTMATTVFAATPTYGMGNGFCGGNGYAGQCFGLMRDSDGNIVDKDAFEKNLDAAIEAGLIRLEDREAFVAMYDFCAENGGGFMGGGCGMRRRWAA